MQGLSGAEAETGVMPGTPDRILDHQPFRQRSTIMRTVGADAKEFVAPSRKERSLGPDMPDEHAAISKIPACDTER
jgi:hypothetical protein